MHTGGLTEAGSPRRTDSVTQGRAVACQWPKLPSWPAAGGQPEPGANLNFRSMPEFQVDSESSSSEPSVVLPTVNLPVPTCLNSACFKLTPSRKFRVRTELESHSPFKRVTGNLALLGPSHAMMTRCRPPGPAATGSHGVNVTHRDIWNPDNMISRHIPS